MIQTKILQGLYNTVQAQIDAYLVEVDKVKQVAEVRFELSTALDKDGNIVVTVLVVWEVVASCLDETEYD
jgi:phage-related protein